MSTEIATNASQQSDAEEISRNNNRISSEPVDKRIRATLEHLNEQISNLMQLISQLIQNSSAKANPTAGSRAHRP